MKWITGGSKSWMGWEKEHLLIGKEAANRGQAGWGGKRAKEGERLAGGEDASGWGGQNSEKFSNGERLEKMNAARGKRHSEEWRSRKGEYSRYAEDRSTGEE